MPRSMPVAPSGAGTGGVTWSCRSATSRPERASNSERRKRAAISATCSGISAPDRSRDIAYKALTPNRTATSTTASRNTITMLASSSTECSGAANSVTAAQIAALQR